MNKVKMAKPKKRGCIYFDSSFKEMRWGKVRLHNEYCAEIVINGKRYRKRSKSYTTCENWLQFIKDTHGIEGA